MSKAHEFLGKLKMENGTITTLDEIVAIGEEERDGHGMANAIIRSVMAIVSILSSSTVIWMVLRSHVRLTTIHHRILLGMSIADILYSLSLAHFNVTSPSDNDYFVWNARGNQATCSAQGFIVFLGGFSALMFSCSINCYYLAVVKYQWSDRYIRKNIEPFLHGIPVAYSLVLSITFLIKENLNDSGGGSCYVAVYEPPHCMGYENGQIPEGFEIPCGRGHDGAVAFYYAMTFITVIIVPIIIGISLGIIYRAVLQQEKRIARYGVNTIIACANLSSDADTADRSRASANSKGGMIKCTICSVAASIDSIRKSAIRSSTTPNQQVSKSRAVLYRALAYSVAYFLVWSFTVIGVCFDIANKEWPTTIGFLSSIFNPLQGFFNFLIFMYPKVTRKKSKGNNGLTWCQAVTAVLWSNGVDQNASQRRGEQHNRNKPQQVVALEVQEEKVDVQPTQMIVHNSVVISAANNIGIHPTDSDSLPAHFEPSTAEENSIDQHGRLAVRKSEIYFKSFLKLMDSHEDDVSR